MILSVVIYRRHFRHSTPISSSLRAHRLCARFISRRSPKSLPHNIFADPHALTPIPSIFYKNGGEGGLFSCYISHLPYTLPSSVCRKSFVCHSYENCRGVYQQFPFWLAPSSAEGFTQSALHEGNDLTSRKNEQLFMHKSFISNTCRPSRKCCKHTTYRGVKSLLSLLDATLTKNRGWGRLWLTRL
jgi:hypothetical protein